VILLADARRIPLRDGSVDCVVTSPPYWGLRDYGTPGQIGLEATPEEYVASMVRVFAEVRRVLNPEGVAWLNLGDCYATGAGPGLKRKDLVGIPWRVAFALQAAGWWLRADVIWHKPNPMPESIRDRPTKAHEYVFLLAKSERYHYDADAIREPHLYGDHPRNVRGLVKAAETPGQPPHKGLRAGFRDKTAGPGPRPDGRRQAPEPGEPNAFHELGRNKRSVWTIATRPYTGAHFATFPPDLVRPCILAGCPPGGLVLDPFVGSGTTVKVAREIGREGIGLDISEAYLREQAADRIRTQRGLRL
jgi:DNA modification methylase